jgi:hypothetical protein
MCAMSRLSPDRTRWLVVVTFAAAMAWMESATVYYLRTLVDRVVPYQENPLPVHAVLGPVEYVREGATLLMLLAVGILAGRTWRQRRAYAAVAFGTWDILYYAFLWITCGWPTSLFEWDVLFLLPLPWWGPVLAPVSIALLMVAWGTLASQWPDEAPATAVTRLSWASSAAGMAIALAVFMIDALRALPGGADAVRQVLPATFNWPMFCLALVLMAAPLAHLARRLTYVGTGDSLVKRLLPTSSPFRR